MTSVFVLIEHRTDMTCIFVGSVVVEAEHKIRMDQVSRFFFVFITITAPAFCKMSM
ncbi:hypothetical protein [Salimicrobium halophilum]|uniref:hypothetical protein n=1 Tax=Salimicrobium halophilum TaxID=86666 RepID=UPI001C409DD4|nr:hypothetical protein [Salimicrobium halophilum]